MSGPSDTAEGCTLTYSAGIENGSGDFETTFSTSFPAINQLGPFLSVRADSAGRYWVQVDVRDKVTRKTAQAYKDVFVHKNLELRILNSQVIEDGSPQVAPGENTLKSWPSSETSPHADPWNYKYVKTWFLPGRVVVGGEFKLWEKFGLKIDYDGSSEWNYTAPQVVQPGELWVLMAQRWVRRTTYQTVEWEWDGTSKESISIHDTPYASGVSLFPRRQNSP